MSQEKIKLFSGEWADEIRWDFYTKDFAPPQDLCTATFCIPFVENKVLLVEHYIRGWEFPGGHIEVGESPDDASRRELEEEARITVSNSQYIGCKEILAKKPRINPSFSSNYPFPTSYIFFYSGIISQVGEFAGNTEIKQRDIFSKEEAISLLQRDSNYKIIEYAYQLMIN